MQAGSRRFALLTRRRWRVFSIAPPTSLSWRVEAVRIDEPGFSTAPVGTPRPSGPVNGPADIGGLAAETMLVWWDGPADAFLNMAADEALAAESLRHGGPVVRFYGWQPTSVSLGAFQRLADARQVAAIAGTRLVRRPSGGGAIVHGSDLTYAAAVPKGHSWGGEATGVLRCLSRRFGG